MKNKGVLFVAVVVAALVASSFIAIPTIAGQVVEPYVPICGEDHTQGKE
jgi:hypothetical protein